MTLPDRDLLVEALVMLRDAKVQMATAIALVSDEIARRELRYRELLQAVQESDEAVANMGGDQPVVVPCATHAFAAIQCSPGVCSEAMDQLDGDEA